MKKQNIAFIILVILLLLIQYGLKPHLQKRTVVKHAVSVLSLMQSGNIDAVLEFWAAPQKSTPFEIISSYEVIKTEFRQGETSPEALFTVKLIFMSPSRFPSGRNWLMMFRLTKLGWKIISFDMLK